jgi:endonuclease/exonuclease/phosphatase family metal-dependent hydrolase
MRLASYNVENLFDRARAMNLDSWEDGKPVLERFAELNALLGELTYTEAIKKKMSALMIELGLERSDTGPFVILRRNRGGLVRRPRAGGMEIVADSRLDWVGSLELRDEPINEHAMHNTARVLIDVGADIFGVVEAESRPVLAAFNREIVAAMGGSPFAHVMVIDGNDERGIDVGLMTREGFPIGAMRSHVDDRADSGEVIFSRDCPEFSVATPDGNQLVVMLNHLKSKGYGGRVASDAKRRLQAKRVRAIYEDVVANGAEYVAVIGDLNDTPESEPLKPLLDSDLKDAFTHPAFDDGGYPGTYGLCNAGDKIDYLLLSPALYARVQRGGVFRSGMWPGSRPKRWDVYEELKRKEDAGSDHAAVWVDLDL